MEPRITQTQARVMLNMNGLYNDDEEALRYLYDLYLYKTKAPPIRKKKKRLKNKEEFWASRKGKYFDLTLGMQTLMNYHKFIGEQNALN